MEKRLQQFRALFYIAGIAAFIIYIWQIVGGYIRSVNIISALSPLFIGLGIAYIIAPLVRLLETLHIKRWLAILIVFVLTVVAISVTISLILPVLVKNFTDLAVALPGYANYWIGQLEKLNIDYNVINLEETLSTVINQGISTATEISKTIAYNLYNIVTYSLTSVMNFILAIFITFYLLMDKELLLHSCARLCPEKYRGRMKEYWEIINSVLSSYIRGLLIMVVVLAVMTYIGMGVVGVRYAIVIAIITGILKVIPIIGAWLGLVPVILFAILDGPAKLIVACLIYLVIQQLDGNVITPKVMGDQVGVHPIAVIVGIFVFGNMFGITGMLVAVPVMGIVKMCYQKIRKEAESKPVKVG